MPPLQPPPFHEDFFDKSGAITEAWKRFLLKTQSQATIPGNLTVNGAFNAVFTLTALTNVTFPTSGTLLTSATAVTNITGTANQIAASAAVGMVTLSLAGPHNFTTLTTHGVLLGQGTSPMSATAVGATLQVLTGVTGADPAWSATPSISGLVIVVGNVDLDNAAKIRFKDTGGTYRSTLFTDASDILYLQNNALGTGGIIAFRSKSGGNESGRFDVSGRLGIGLVPTAFLHLLAGTATANTAPLKFTSGTLLSTPEAGAIEFLTDAFYGTLTTGPTRKQFAMVDAASIGAAGEVAKIDTTGLTANVGATTLYAVPSTGEGFYRVSAYVVETTAGSLSSVLPNVQIVYTDKDSNTSVTIDATPILGAAGIGQSAALSINAVGAVASGVIPIYVKASTTIQYQTVNYASNFAGMTYALRIRLEVL